MNFKKKPLNPYSMLLLKPILQAEKNNRLECGGSREILKNFVKYFVATKMVLETNF